MGLKINPDWHKTTEALPILDKYGMSSDVIIVDMYGNYSIGFHTDRLGWIQVVDGRHSHPIAPPIYWHEIPPLTS